MIFWTPHNLNSELHAKYIKIYSQRDELFETSLKAFVQRNFNAVDPNFDILQIACQSRENYQVFVSNKDFWDGEYPLKLLKSNLDLSIRY